MEFDFKIEFIGVTLPFSSNDKLMIGDENIRNGDVVWFERTDSQNLTIHRVASRPVPSGVTTYRLERAPSGAVRYVQLNQSGVEFDERTKAMLEESLKALEQGEVKRPWWKFW